MPKREKGEGLPAMAMPIWWTWSLHVALAIDEGTRTTVGLLKIRPGKLRESKIRNSLAFLEQQGIAYYKNAKWWLTEYGKQWSRGKIT